MQTLKSFIRKYLINLDTKLVDKNPHMADPPQWAEGSRHWKCILWRGSSRMTVYFSQGPAIEREPQTEDVLDCIASDSAGFDQATNFAHWCAEYGYSEDSRAAERIYKTVGRQASQLSRLLGDSRVYHELLYNTERL